MTSKKILLISYRNYKYDGRLRELKKVFSSIGSLTCFTIVESGNTGKGILDYFKFCMKVKKYIKNIKDVDILVLDDRKAIIPGYLVKKKLNPRFTILDCREMYFFNEVHHLAGKLGCLIERSFIPDVDIIIEANKERAEIVSREYKLKNKPLVFENIRKLEYSDTVDFQNLKTKYEKYINNEPIVISTAGCNILQKTDVLVRNFSKINIPLKLFLVGDNSSNNKKIIDEIINENKLNNVVIIGRVAQDELKYLLSISSIGIVAYSQDGRNNKYCASGKVYEYINEGIPIVSTSNPPLKNLCVNEKIGVVDDSFADGILKVLNNLKYYRSNALRLSSISTVETNNEKLTLELMKMLK